MSGEAVLGPRALNRALLARQHLLRRADGVSARAAVEHLVGLQAQAPLPPYLALWSRLEGFDPHELGRMLTEREVVRLSLMRGTVHLVTVTDALGLRPWVQVVLERGHNGVFGRRMGGAEPAAIEATTRELLAAEPLTGRELARRLIQRGIGGDEEALTNATRVYAPLVQLPPRGVWGASGPPRYATLEGWPGRGLERDPEVASIVLRYLAALGPASVMDMQTWSGLTKLRPVFDGLRERLVTFRDEAGKELFDLPDAARSSTACCAGRGGSTATARGSGARRWRSPRSRRCRPPSATRWSPRPSGSSPSSPRTPASGGSASFRGLPDVCRRAA